jgi:hypothetical protein
MQLFVIDNQGKKRKASEVKCVFCGITFLKPTKFVKIGVDNFCCTEHYHLFKRNGETVICANCGISKVVSRSKYEKCKSKKFFCSRKCQSLSQCYDSGIDYLSNYGNGNSLYRTNALKHYGSKCEQCGYDEYESILEVHHIDFDRNNNNIENLSVLCCRCHRHITLRLKTFEDCVIRKL